MASTTLLFIRCLARFGRYPALKGAADSNGVQRPTIFRFPSNCDRGARLELGGAFVVWHFDDEIVMPADRNPGADMVSEIDQLLHAGTEDVRHAALGGIDHHAFRP